MILNEAETYSGMSTQAPVVVNSDASTQTTGTTKIPASTQRPAPGYVDASTRTDTISPQETCNPTQSSVAMIKESDAKTRFYTGLQTWALFQYIFSTLVIHIPGKRASRVKMTQQDEFLLVLMRLRLNLVVEDLAYRFGIAKSTVACIFDTWIDVMVIKFKFLVKWPTREMVQAIICLRYLWRCTQKLDVL